MSKAIKRREVKPAPKQERARKRQSAILAAAEALLLDGSPTDVSTTAIALKAGIPVGSIYRYFEDKEDILEQLYHTAYNEVETTLVDQKSSLVTGSNFGDEIHQLLNAFWQAARAHPTFIPLTRWANSHYSLWDVTPGQNSSLAKLIEGTLLDAGVEIPDTRKKSAQKTLVTTVSVLTDVIIEEDDAVTAKAQIDELAVLLEAYIGTFGR